MRRLAIRLILSMSVGAAALAAGGAVPQPSALPPSPPTFDVVLEEVQIPMSDGVRLAADLWRPKGAGDDRPFPVLLEYLPYRKTDGRGGRYDLYAYFVRRGYVVARVDIRGTGNSEGTLIPYEYSEIEQRDGEEVIDWLVATAVLERQGRHVRDLLGRLQLDPHGDAQPAGAQGDHRRGRHRRSLPGRRALHGRHDARRLLGDEPGPRQRDARRARLPDRREVLRRALRPAALDADLQAAAARRPVLGPHRAQDALRRDPDSRPS